MVWHAVRLHKSQLNPGFRASNLWVDHLRVEQPPLFSFWLLHLHYRQNMNLAQLSHSHIPHLPCASSFSRYVQLQNMKLAFIPDSSAKQCPYSYADKKIQYVKYRLFWIFADIKFQKSASRHANITFCLCTHCVLLLLESYSNLLIISAINNLCILLELWWKAHWSNHCCSCQPPS